MNDHLIIFDTQIKKGVPMHHLPCIGQYIVEHQPEYIIHVGDHWDMQSLSTYDRGTKKAEGSRYESDIYHGQEGMIKLLKPLHDYQGYQRSVKRKLYKPKMHFCIGNHEERIMRHVNANPHLSGKLGYHDFGLEQLGWTVHNFLKPVVLDGIEYVHYVQNRNSPNAKASSRASLAQTKMSTIQGHRPGLDISTEWSDKDGMMWSVTCGASYLHDEGYKGPQGNKHWRGILHAKNVLNGDFDPAFIRLDTLIKEYG